MLRNPEEYVRAVPQAPFALKEPSDQANFIGCRFAAVAFKQDYLRPGFIEQEPLSVSGTR
jgi:hypothetical protein